MKAGGGDVEWTIERRSRGSHTLIVHILNDQLFSFILLSHKVKLTLNISSSDTSLPCRLIDSKNVMQLFKKQKRMKCKRKTNK